MKVIRVGFALLACAALIVLPACSGGDDDDEEAAGSTQEEDRPTRTPRPGRSTPTPEPDQAPVFEPGGWTSGEASVTTSGGVEIAVEGMLLARSSSSQRDTTRLTYTNDLDTINFSISREYQPFAMTVFQGRTYISTNQEPPCEVTYSSTEENHIEGTFRCEGARIEQGGTGQATIEGTFWAKR